MNSIAQNPEFPINFQEQNRTMDEQMRKEIDAAVAEIKASLDPEHLASIEALLNTEPHYFDRERHPLNLLEWGMLRERQDYCRVDLTKVIGGVEVSTVWIGVPLSISWSEPKIFESAILTNEDGVDVVARYVTEADARAGHSAIVRKIRNTQRYKRAYARRRR